MILVTLLVFGTTMAQSGTDEEAIKKAVKAFAKAGDSQDVEDLKGITHDQYRLVWYGGKDAPFVANKTMFLAQFEKKEWGGDSRKVSIHNVEVFDGVNATAKAISDGEKAQMRSLFSLIKVEGEWKIIGELVNASFK